MPGPSGARKIPFSAPPGRLPCGAGGLSSARRPRSTLWFSNDGKQTPSRYHFGEAARLEQREDEDRNIVLPCQGDRRGVHHLEVFGEHLEVAETIVAMRAV